MTVAAISGATRTSISHLKGIADEMAAAQKRLATGKRVAAIGDDPAAFFRAGALTTEAATLTEVNGRLGGAASALGAATTGLSTVKQLLENARGLGNQALQVQDTLVRVTATNTTRNAATTSIIGGSKLATGNTVTVGDGTTTATYTAATGNTVQSFLDAVNGTANLQVRASLNANGQVELQAKGGNNVTVGGTAAASNLNAALGLAAGTTTFTASTARQSLAQQFDALRAQIDQTIADSGFEGVNLLKTDTLSLKLNEDGSSTFALAGANLSASGLGLASAGGAAFQSDTDINASLSQVTGALSALAAASAVLASNSSILQIRRDFNAKAVDLLLEGADQLTANDNEADSALLLALQTRQQLAATAFSITNNDGSALRLLMGG